jgi:hypothetical protein
VFCLAFSPGQAYFPVHLLLVALQHGDDVSEDQHIGCFQLAIGGLLERILRFGKTVGEKIAPRKRRVPEHLIGLGPDSSLGHLNRSLITAGAMSGKAP